MVHDIYLVIGAVLIFVLYAYCKRTGKKEEETRCDIYLESADGEVTLIATNQREGWFYMIDDVLCYFDESNIKAYLPIDPACKVFSTKSQAPQEPE